MFPATKMGEIAFQFSLFCLFVSCFMQQGMPMRPQINAGGQPVGMMPIVGMQTQAVQQQIIIPQQSPLPTDQQNGKNNSVQLDPFGAF